MLGEKGERMLRKKRPRRHSVLVVDDDDGIRQALTLQLRQLYPDLIAESACDVSEAIEKFDSAPFDLVLLDMSLGPGLDGLELLQALRRKEAPFRAIGISGFVKDYAYRAWKSGLDDLLEKPVAPDKLMEAIDTQ